MTRTCTNTTMWMNTHITCSLLCAQWQAAQWDMKYCPAASSICFFYFSLSFIPPSPPIMASSLLLLLPSTRSLCFSFPSALLPEHERKLWVNSLFSELSLSLFLMWQTQIQTHTKLWMNTKLWALFPWQQTTAFTCYYAALHLLGPFSDVWSSPYSHLARALMNLLSTLTHLSTIVII